MTIARVSATLRTRGLGLSALLALPMAVIGCSSLGTAATPTLLQSADDLTDRFGRGPGPSMLAKIGAEAGYPLLFCKATTSTAGQLGAYAQRGGGSAAAGTLSADGGNSSTAVPALTGTPASGQCVPVLIEVVGAGANIAANPTVKISLDGGLTWYATDATNVSATATAIGTSGLSLAWTDGSFVEGDTWTAYGANSATDADATGTATLALSGTPVDAFDVRVSVTRATTTAGDGTGAIRYSLDGGETYAPELPIPTSRAVVLGDSGVTVTFSAASLVVDDEYRFKTSAPVFTASAMDTALQALEAVGVTDHEGVFIAGAIDATYFDEVEASHDRLIAASKPRWILGHARGQASALAEESVSTWAAALLGASPGFSGQNANLVAVAAGEATVKDSLHDDAELRRSVLFALASRVAGIDVSEHPGRVRSGPLSLETLVHDLAASSTLTSLDSQGFIGAQSISGVSGYYATATTRAAAGSDFVTLMRVRVMCFACRAALSRMVEECNESIPTNPDGTIRADVADGLDASVTSFLTRELGRRVSSVSVQVDRTADLITTSTLPFKVRVVPLGYSEAISLDLGYTIARS